MITIKIHTENAAFHEGGNCGENKEEGNQEIKAWEVARILKSIAEKLEINGHLPLAPIDYNGHSVGVVETTRPDRDLI